ncbi:MAG: hypothetical protein KatS3mg025_1496 [Bacteroidia bacterium]|nr:MAG: hypothetical protein KatS3mg025_1496 [Bacteroidia bacterium]
MSERLKEIAALAENTSPEELVKHIESLHQEVLEDPDQRATFEQEAPTIADGLYLPNIFWIYLAAFLQERETYRPFLEYLLQVFVQQPPNAFAEKRLKPLLYVYFSLESEFFLDKLWETLKRYGRTDKLSFLESVRDFIKKNPTTVSIFRQKFELLADYMPDFEALTLPLPQLRQTLQRATQE